MANTQSNSQSESTMGTVGQIIWRLITSAVVLAITAFFTPGFSIRLLDIGYCCSSFNCYRLFNS